MRITPETSFLWQFLPYTSAPQRVTEPVRCRKMVFYNFGFNGKIRLTALQSSYKILYDVTGVGVIHVGIEK